MCYPDLAAGAAYKALLLADALQDDSDEYHDAATSALESEIADLELWLETRSTPTSHHADQDSNHAVLKDPETPSDPQSTPTIDDVSLPGTLLPFMYVHY